MVWVRRGWDFEVGRTLSLLHKDPNSDFCKAAAKLKDLPFDGDASRESFWGSPYGRILDEACKHVLSKREGWQNAGVYVLGGHLIAGVAA